MEMIDKPDEITYNNNRCFRFVLLLGRNGMRPQLTFRQYRSTDLAMLSLILALCEWLVVTAATRWFPDQLYTLSVTPVVTAIVMIRWGMFGFIPALLGGAVFCLASRAASWQYLIYMGGNLFALALVPVIRRAGWRTIRDSALYAMLYGLGCVLLMQLGRALIALCLGHGDAFILFFTTDVMSAVFCAVLMWITRRLDGVLEDQKHYLDRVARETEDGGNDT